MSEISFKYFHHNDLPKPWEDYKTEFSDDGSFQEMYLEGRKHISNINQYIKDYSIFNKLRKKIVNAISEFEDSWKAKSEEI